MSLHFDTISFVVLCCYFLFSEGTPDTEDSEGRLGGGLELPGNSVGTLSCGLHVHLQPGQGIQLQVRLMRNTSLCHVCQWF